MLLSAIFVILSMIIDSVISNYINYQILNPSLITPLFVIVSLPLIYQFFEKNNNKFLKFVMIAGLIYDLFFVGTLLLNTIIFFILGNIIIAYNKFLANNSLSTIFLIILNIIAYNTLNYGILYVLNVHNYEIWYLFNIIKSTLILNIIYGLVCYYILDFISIKFKIKRIC